MRFTDERRSFVSEATIYRLLKAQDLITSPAYIVIKAANEFRDNTPAPNQLWQTDFTYLKVIGWGWYYLSTVLDDFLRFIVAWKLCATMQVGDVTATLDLALAVSAVRDLDCCGAPSRAASAYGPARSRLTTAMAGCAASQSRTGSQARPGRRSKGAVRNFVCGRP